MIGILNYLNTLLFLLVVLTLQGGFSQDQRPLLPPLQPLPILPPSSPLDGVNEHNFRLRHIFHHGMYTHPNLLRRLDVEPMKPIWQTSETGALAPYPALKARSRGREILRLKDRSRQTIESYLLERRLKGPSFAGYDHLAWTTDEVSQPNITDKETVLNLARMCQDAYVQVPNTEDWQEVGKPWNSSADFGWQNDGLRGHVFIDDANTTIIIGLKGTSPAVFDGAETTTNDKVNDNLLFSCCCARVSSLWKTVCDCYTNTYQCSTPCLSDAIMEESRYYRSALNLYYNVTAMYPEMNVWITGHSLGGAVSSLLGMTYGLPVVTFEAPAEGLAASRIGLPDPAKQVGSKKLSGTYHFGHNADPIYMGVCNGATSLCSLGGYAMETKCHAGNVCLYDVVNDFGWRVGLSYHKIKLVIDDVLVKYEEVPECVPEDEECIDCFNWKFHSGIVSSTTNPIPTTTTTTTSTTTTCKHPGWWGCLDETTTAGEATTATTTSTTVTCKKYGWFGNCLDPVPTTMTITSTTPVDEEPMPTTSCETPGYFWGCYDDGDMTTTEGSEPTLEPTPTQTSTTPIETETKTTKTKSCETPGYVWGCYDKPTTTATTTTTTKAGTTTTVPPPVTTQPPPKL